MGPVERSVYRDLTTDTETLGEPCIVEEVPDQVCSEGLSRRDVTTKGRKNFYTLWLPVIKRIYTRSLNKESFPDSSIRQELSVPPAPGTPPEKTKHN